MSRKLYELLRPLFFRLDPETAHHFAMFWLEHLPSFLLELFAAGADKEDVGRFRVLHLQGNVRENLLVETLPNVTSGDEFAVPASQRAIVDAELHLDGRRIQFDEGLRRRR